ncbi:3-oxoacyl-ACP reductase [Persicimonas caeni]|uniref:3-oxoacyl-ACP reductase n=1 Tax=Persicimonas caeni TaxID=2292766 RepID=A0A4Y6PPM6_PERCE|nr:3-oxoacyl-ACP reductase [Persicimonas caeni]QDG50220.1 3-oxoacyl-ACP reductase [Persicimonas caeni]QED31441.1 3-oxoacyl-ACP reductase [Persicimonas caeni]
MTDFLLELSKNPNARNIIKTLGLPIPMPQDLARNAMPREERPLANRDVAVWTSSDSTLAPVLAKTLAEAGANPHVPDDAGVREVFEGPGEAYGRPATTLDEGDARLDGFVFDATTLDSPASLRALYDFFHPQIGRLARNARIVVLGRPHEAQKTPEAAAAQGALEGFMRSLAKEIGKKGATANLLYVEEGADEAVAGPLRFFLSARSTYVDGQSLDVTKTAGAVPEANWLRPLDGKVAMVTGAARGIGRATAELLAGEGAKVVCLDLPKDDGPTAKLAREIDGGVLLQDVSADDAPARIAEQLQEEYGGVDIVVHNAGITRDKTIKRMKSDWWDSAVDINLAAVARITGKLIDDNVLHDGGRLICLSSIAGVAGNMGQTNYAASKAGIIGIVEHWSKALADRGITANAIAPGFIETRLTDAMPVAIREAARRLNNLSQGGRPVDVGQAITFLATPQAQGVTGQVLRVCGGALVGR